MTTPRPWLPGQASPAGPGGRGLSRSRDQLATLLPVRERVLGVEHPDTLAVRHSHAHRAGKEGDAAAAHDGFAALLPVYERVLGPEYPTTQAARARLARWASRRRNANGLGTWRWGGGAVC